MIKGRGAIQRAAKDLKLWTQWAKKTKQVWMVQTLVPRRMRTVMEKLHPFQEKDEFGSNPQPFWHQKPISWKTVFPEGQGCVSGERGCGGKRLV